MTEERIIEVDRQFYVALMEYLEPAERWHDADAHGIVLFCGYENPLKKLVFRARKTA